MFVEQFNRILHGALRRFVSPNYQYNLTCDLAKCARFACD
jgi:hypothetical protein